MKREALILDDLGGATPVLVDILSNNGYIVHVITTKGRSEKFLGKPTYIHVIPSETRESSGGDVEENSQTPALLAISEAIKDIDFDNVETVLLLSPNDDLNIMLATLAKEKGVPRVVILVRDVGKAKEAKGMSVDVLDISHFIMARIQRILSLKFARLTPISGEIYMLETLITGDSRLLGKTIEDIENGFGVDAVVIRNGKLARSSETILHAGDILIAVGSRDNLNELVENA